MDRRKTVTRVGIVVAIVVILLLLLRGCGEKPPVEPDEDLLGILIELREELEWPGIDVATAAKNLRTPEAAIDFVRNDTKLIIYPGEFADPDAVLRTRVASVLDRARLLEALLCEMGLETRMRMARPEYWKPKVNYPGNFERETPVALQKLADYLGHDLGGTEDEFATLREAFEKRTDVLKGEVNDALTKIQELAPEALQPASPKRLSPAVKEWAWVEYRTTNEGEWIPADTTYEAKVPNLYNVEYRPQNTSTRITLEGVRGDGSRVNLMHWSGEAAARDLELLFLPADRKPQELMKVKEPNEIWAWAPVLQMGGEMVRGKPFTPQGAILTDVAGLPATSLDGDGRVDVYAPPVIDFETASATCGDGKRVRLRMNVTTEELPHWHAGHFSVTDGGLPVRNLRLESARAAQRPVILVIDTSGSMQGQRAEIAKQAASRLIETLPKFQKVGVLAHGFDKVYTVQELVPKGEGEALAKVAEMRFEKEQRILDSIDTALNMPEEPAYIVFLTDGLDTESVNPGYQEKLESTLQAIRDSNSTLIPVGIGEADPGLMGQFAKASGTEFLVADNVEDLPDLYAHLGSLISGSVELSYAIPEDTEPGSQREALVKLEGFDGEAPAIYKVNEGTPFGLVRIEMKIDGPPNLKATRTVADFSGGYDGWRMLTKTTLWMSPSVYPQHIVESRRVDNWIETLRMAEFIDGGELDRRQLSRSISFHHAKTVNGIRTFHTALAGDAHQPIGPTLWISTESLRLEGENIVRSSRLDWPSGFDWPATENRKQLAESMLALLAAEGAVYGGDSVNVRLLSGGKLLAVYRSGGELPDGLPPSLARQLDKDKRLLVTAAEKPREGWRIDLDTGGIYGYLAEGHEIAKGASVEEVAAEYRKIRSILQLYSYLGGGGLSAAFSPAGGVFSALCSFFDQVVRLYCYSAIMMNQVSDAIESGGEDFDPEKAKKVASTLCETSGDPEDFARDLMRESAYGFVRGTAENVVAGMVGGKIGDAAGANPGGLVDGAIAGITSTAVAAADPTPGSFADMMKSLGFVGSPSAVSSPSLIQRVDAAIAGE